MKDFLKELSFRAYRFASRAGVYLVPAHFYAPLANVHQLGKTRSVWARKSDLPGVASDLDDQAENLRQICLPFRDEYAGNHTYNEAVEEHFGSGYGYIEAQALHGVLRHYRPRRVIEVGSGVSTYCMLKALERNEQETGQAFHLTCIEPYPPHAAPRARAPRPDRGAGTDCSLRAVRRAGIGRSLVHRLLPRRPAGQ